MYDRKVPSRRRRCYFRLERLESRLTPTLGFVGPLSPADFMLMQRSGEAFWQNNGGSNFKLQEPQLASRLAAAPKQFTNQTPVVVAIPRPGGGFEHFNIWEAADMEPGLAAQFPTMKTYRGQSIETPATQLAADVGPNGFHAKVAGPGALWYIDPIDPVHGLYSVAIPQATPSQVPIGSSPVDDDELIGAGDAMPGTAPSSSNSGGNGGGISPAFVSTGQTLRTFRLAVAATGEYYTFSGSDVSATQANIVTLVSRINLTLERDFTAHLTLIANNTSIIYTNAGTDPYTGNNPFSMVNENQTNLDSVIGTANYDIGFVFSANSVGAGVGYLRAIGNSFSKAGGAAMAPNSETPTSFDFEENVTHEMGHQFGAQHGFNGVNGAAATNRNGQAAVEVGSGSSIMSYPGICGADDLQSAADLYFSSMSYDQVQDFLSTIPSVGTSTPTNNLPPVMSTGNDAAIPANTPFALSGPASDPNGDNGISYSWEERDLGVAQALGSPDNGFSPILRDFAPVSSPTRYFPNLTSLLAGTASKGEQLPTTNRDLRFREFVRDNRLGGGGVTMQDLTLNVVNTGSAFAVTSPNTAVSWPGGSAQLVTWNVAGTTAAPINTSLVNIKLSSDGGLNYTTYVSNTPNDGSEVILLPAAAVANARIKVEAVGNYFFDISDVNFTITAPPAMFVSTTSPAAGSVVTAPVTLDVTFSQTINSSTIGTGDLTLSQGTVTAASLFSANVARYTLGGFTSDGPVLVTMPAGAVSSTTANPNAQYLSAFTVDVGTVEFPTPLTAASPVGTFVYGGSVMGAVNTAADTDAYTINLDAGQVLSVVATPSATLRPNITLVGPGGVNLSASGAGSGQSAIIQSAAITLAGTYTATISSLAASTGVYSLRLDLNAAVEAEPNDTVGAAQSIIASGFSLGGGATRYALRGRTDALSGGLATEAEPNNTFGTANDATRSLSAYSGNLYQLGWTSYVGSQYFNIGAMQVSDIITGTASSIDSLRGTAFDPNLFFYTPPPPYGYYAGAGDQNGGPGNDAVVYRFSIDAANTIYAGVFPSGLFTDSFQVGLLLENTSTAPLTGGNVSVVTAMNSDLNGAADLSTSWRPIQYRGVTTGSIAASDSDFYKYTFNAGDEVTFRAHSTSDLDVQINLRNSAGTIIAQDDGTDTYWTPDEDAALYAFVIPTTGTYYVEVKSRTGTGSYSLETLLSAATPPPALISTPDYASITLAAGQTVTLALKTQTVGNVSLDLVNASNTVLVGGTVGATNYDKTATYTAPAGGTYYIRVQGDPNVDYVVTATTGAAVDQEANDSFATAQMLTGGKALGAIMAGNDDWYSFSASAGDLMTFVTATPAGGAGEFVNNLDPMIELYSPSNVLLGSDDNSAADGRNAVLARTAAVAGTYRVRVVGAASTSGEYTLVAEPPTVTNLKIDDGTAQRSMIRSLTITFSEAVTFSGALTSAITLIRNTAPNEQAGTTGLVNLAAAQGPGNTVVLTFLTSGANPVNGVANVSGINISLPDGRYTLNIDASKVMGNASMANLDGDNNGSAGGNYVLASAASPAQPTNIFRYFGDQNGDGVIGSNDFSPGFKQAFGAVLTPSNDFFDYNGDGVIGTNDFTQFKNRFNGIFP
jgi:Metallo-peptidase family M12B Reprolysin-like/Bacterial pre-peptidase C-terminal domain